MSNTTTTASLNDGDIPGEQSTGNALPDVLVANAAAETRLAGIAKVRFTPIGSRARHHDHLISEPAEGLIAREAAFIAQAIIYDLDQNSKLPANEKKSAKIVVDRVFDEFLPGGPRKDEYRNAFILYLAENWARNEIIASLYAKELKGLIDGMGALAFKTWAQRLGCSVRLDPKEAISGFACKPEKAEELKQLVASLDSSVDSYGRISQRAVVAYAMAIANRIRADEAETQKTIAKAVKISDGEQPLSQEEVAKRIIGCRVTAAENVMRELLGKGDAQKYGNEIVGFLTNYGQMDVEPIQLALDSIIRTERLSASLHATTARSKHV